MCLFSKTKTFAIATAIALLSISTAPAQFTAPTNARVDALAGAHVSDISGIYRYPVMMTGYLDHVQATWGQGFVGVKSVSSMFSFGVLANQGPLAPVFTAAAVGRLNGYAFPAGLGAGNFNDNLVIPHLLLGFDLGAAAIGADVFLEYAGYSASNGTDDVSGSITHPGARLSGKFGVADAEVMVKIGLGAPSVSASGVAGSDKLTSNAGLYLETGAEAGMSLGGADWVLGACYTRSNHRFALGNAADPNATAYSLLNVYLGVEFNFVETAVAAAGYSLNRSNSVTSQPDVSGSPSQQFPIDYSHSLYAGLENAWENAWIFDSFQLRGGALYTITSTGGKPSDNTNYAQPAIHSTVQPVVGIGVSKAFATIDLSLNPGAWGGLVTGPDVALVTATIKF